MKLKTLILVLLLQLVIFGCSKEENANYLKPEISTSEVSEITNTTAICGGDLSSDGGKTIKAKGLVCHTSANATLEVNTVITTEAKELGKFVSKLCGLTADTKHFVRAYATNDLETTYGVEQEFTTTNDRKPEITTTEVSEITYTTAICGGNLISDGDKAITAKGVVWHTSANATIEVNTGISTGVTELGEFVSNLTDLTADTKYFVRAYASNAFGFVYGEEKEFSTLDYSKPVISTSVVSVIMKTTAICGGNLTSDGGKTITAKGVVWHTSVNATIEINTGIATGVNIAGEFVSILADLTADTKYFVRAYASNEFGIVYGEEREFTTKDASSIDMISVQGGTFQMGSTTGDSNEMPIHSVTLSSFEIGKYEVTQAQWKAVMDGVNPSRWIGDDLPVEQVSWNEVQTFITKLNEQTGLAYRLPTEAEWEFAARGGNLSKGYTYSGSNTIADVSWYSSNSLDLGIFHENYGTNSVGTKQANELDIYDMSGNVMEWCNDWFGNYGSEKVTNPHGPSSGSYRVYRCGGWCADATYCRVAARYYLDYIPSDSRSFIGFRLARSL